MRRHPSGPRIALIVAFALALGGAWAPACVRDPGNGGGETNMSISGEQAIDAAKQFARDQGRAVDRYDAVAERDGDAWNVRFTPGPSQPKPSPGDFFTVVIDSRGKEKPRLIPGK
jgi:hypothetical protein